MSHRGIGIACWVGFACSIRAQVAAGQCTPFFPPTECPTPMALTCPDDVLGEFCDGDTWFVGPGGLGGVLRSGNQIQIDQNCDGDVSDPGDATFNLPSEISQILSACPQCSLELRLSPSQETLHARVLSTMTTVPGCAAGQVRAYFFALGTPPNLIRFSGPNNGACMNNIADGPIFYDRQGDPVRTAVTLGGASAGKQAVLWADLVGRAVNLDTFTYFQGLQRPQFSQRGNAAFMRTVSGGFATRYYLVDLCRSPIGAAGAVSTAPFPPSTNSVSADITGSTDALFAVITHNTGHIDVPLDDCLCGACCDGASCTADTAVADCAGTFIEDADCSPNPCSGATPEACCFPSGVCSSLSPDECTDMGGTPQPGMTCATAGCVPETEACCDPATGSCFDVEAALCTGAGQLPAGPGTTCAGTVCPPPAGTQACCLPTGACLNLVPAGPFPSCTVFSGTPQGAGSNCLSGTVSCPTAALSISKSAPATVAQGQEFTYTITYGNTGPSAAAGVQVLDTLPSGATFVSASATPGGTAAVFAGGTVTWTVGTLPAGTTGEQVTITVRAGCGTSIVNSAYRIMGTPGGTVFGSPVTTTITAASSAPITIGVASVDLNGPPLKQDDILEHTITLTNTVAVERIGIRVGGQFGGDIQAGYFSTFEAAVDAAGGAFVVFPNLSRFQWQGPVGPSAVLNIVFTTRAGCVPAGRDLEILNQGAPISVRSPCGVQLGITTPTDEFEALRPVVADLVALNLFYTPGSMNFGRRVQAAREGASLEFEITLTEQYNVDHAAVTASLVIPTGINPDPAADPLINPPPGASYDAAMRRISYSGPIAAGQMISIRFNATLDAAAACSTELELSGSVAACANIAASLLILVVPEMPQGPHVIGLDQSGCCGGLWMMELVPNAPMRRLLCIQGEIFVGMDRLPDGEIWVVDAVQIIRFNPLTEPPQLEIFGLDFMSDELDIGFPGDVAFDPTSAERSLIFSGDEGRLRRYYPGRPPGLRVEAILDDPALGDLRRVSVDPEGMIAAISPLGLVRIDPSGPLPVAPGTYAQFNMVLDTTFGGLLGDRSEGPVNLTVDTDGDYLVTVLTTFLEDFGHPSMLPLRLTYVASLVKIDRTSGTIGLPTGTPDIIVERLAGLVACFGGCPPNPPPADLSDAMFPITDPYNLYGSAVSSTGDVFMGGPQHHGALFVVERQPSVGGRVIVAGPGPFFAAVDLEVIGAPTPQIPGDLDGDGDVDAVDFALFEGSFGSTSGDQDYDPAADLDGDGDIDCDDWRLFRAAWSPPRVPFFRPCLPQITPGNISPTAARSAGDASVEAKGGYCGSGAAAAMGLLLLPLRLLMPKRGTPTR